MVRAVFLDFYGTVVEEDGAAVREISARIARVAQGADPGAVAAFWWDAFQKRCLAAKGETFAPQRALERDALAETAAHFGAEIPVGLLCETLFAQWSRPALFPDAGAFFASCPVPIFIVSNADNADMRSALEFHQLSPAGVCTSEDARAYKPDPAPFQCALRRAGCAAGEALHIGDSLTGDVRGAAAAGIPALWLNRGRRQSPPGVRAVRSLSEVLQTEYFR